MQSEAYFNQIEHKITTLLSEKKYKEAYNLCIDVLNKFPDKTDFLKLKGRIEKKVEAENEKVIKTKIEEVKPLWEGKKYTEILKILKPLLNIAPNNSKLKKEIYNAQEAYKEEIEKLQKEFDTKETQRLTQLLETNESMFFEELFNLEKNNPGNKNILELTKKFKLKLIDRKIKDKEDLIYSDKYEAIANFISQLKKIDDSAPQIKELEKILKTHKFGKQVEDKNGFVYEAENHLITLMKLKKYDKAIEVANEILEIGKYNERIIKILNKANKKLFNQTKEISIDSIYKNIDSLKEEYERDKNKFVKI